MTIVLAGSVKLVGRRAIAPSPMRCRAMLAALALQPNRMVSYDRLAEMLWDEPIESARSNLRTLATGIRSAIVEAKISSSVALTTHRASHGGIGGYSLAVREEQVDLLLAIVLKQRAKELIGTDPLRAKQLCEDAIALGTGTFGPDLPATLWFQRQQERFARLHDSLNLLHRCLSMMVGEYGDESANCDLFRESEPSSVATELSAIQLYCQGFVAEALEQISQASKRYREIGLDLPDSSRRVQMEILNDDKGAIIEAIRSRASSI
ncbi:AfsR/SARP family transcriptional regulator [Glycomyces harbinensis]|uniref:AfsR/SARP family transcriptional regulator n=1 Tax=Glycomyces harbinensis TaxID=58114 RepID=UPI0015A519E4|nr:hypothetical protein [Glycomyces harbinensis]